MPDALGLLERHGAGLLVMSGGTVVMPLINEGRALPERVMSLRRAGARGIEQRGENLAIGAGTTLTELLAQGRVPMLRDAARNTASWSIRNLATVGGNLFTPPHGGDVAVALLALDARVRLAGPRGDRQVPLDDFYTGLGTTACAPDELLVEILVPATERETAYLKFGRKQANTPAVVTVAIGLERRDGVVTDARICLGAAGPHPLRAPGAEAAVVGSALEPAAIHGAAAAAARDCQPMTDAVASEWYRSRMVEVFVRRALEQLAAQRGHRMGQA
jgi:CO/xanthine dehydrogenase FAD-binding subunit